MICKDKKIIVLLPPKVGSTSIEKALTNAGCTPFYIRNPSFPTIHLTLKEHLDMYGINYSDLPQYKIAQITRDPVTRFVSSYYHTLKLTNNVDGINLFFDKVKSLHNLLPLQKDEFYNKFYSDPLHKEKSFKNNNWGGIRFFYLQTWWNDINYDNINYFKLEDLSDNIESLSTYLELNLQPLLVLNKSNTKKFNLITPLLEENIKHLFKEDINALGYGF